MMATSPVKTIQDAMEREATLGATGRSSTVAIYPTLLNHVVGTKFKLVMGYKGSAEAMLAMERGEVEGHSTTWDGVKSRADNHLRDKTINILVQYGLKRHPELPDIPASVELGKTPEQVEALRVFANATDVGRFILSTPDTPAERIQALRRAFDAMVEGPRIHRRPEAAEAGAWPADRRGAAEAGRGGGQCLAGDHRAGQGHLFRELIGETAAVLRARIGHRPLVREAGRSTGPGHG